MMSYFGPKIYTNKCHISFLSVYEFLLIYLLFLQIGANHLLHLCFFFILNPILHLLIAFVFFL